MSPIKAEFRQRYPTGWERIRRDAIARAGDKCGACGTGNKQPHPRTGSTVALTVIQLDGRPENAEEGNLLALCLPCRGEFKRRMAR